MNRFTTQKSLFRTAAALTLLSMGTFSADTWAQQELRTYASRQAYETGGLGVNTVTNQALAVDTDPQTSANMTISLGLGATASLFLDFHTSPTATATYPDMIPANTPITLKFTAPAGLTGLTSGIEIQPITNMSKDGSGVVSNYTDVGTPISGAALLTLLSGEGQQEITITPSAPYQGIRIQLSSGVVSAAFGIEVFSAYIMEPDAGPINCDDRLDVLDGVTSNDLANLATGIGSVQNPLLAIDGDDNTYAQLNTGTEVLNATYLNTVFNSTSKIGDKLELILQNSIGGLLSLGVLTNFEIRLYEGQTLTKTIANNSSLLTLDLLSGATDIYTLTAVIDDAVFDRAEVIFGGVAGVLDGLRVYEVNRKAADPILTAAEQDLYVYAGQSVTLSASPGATGDVVAWFDAIEGTSVANPYLTTAADGGTTLSVFAAATRSGCNENSDYQEVFIHVIDFDTELPDDGFVNIGYNSSVAITNPGTTPNTPDYLYTITSGALPPGITLDPATGQLLGTPTGIGTFNFEVTVVDNGNGGITVGVFPYTIIIDTPLPITGTSLTAELYKHKVQLSWATHTETNNVHFEIEHSTDGRLFQHLATVASKADKGNSNTELNYRFVDEQPAEGSNYYRLKQSDKDGRTSYSNIAFIDYTSSDDFIVYPNPASNKLYIAGNKLQEIVMYNLLGQRVLKVKASSEREVLNLSTIAAGSYLIQVRSAEKTQTFNLIIQK